MTQEEKLKKKFEEAVYLLGGMARQAGAKSAVIKVKKDGGYSLTFTAPKDGSLNLE